MLRRFERAKCARLGSYCFRTTPLYHARPCSGMIFRANSPPCNARSFFSFYTPRRPFTVWRATRQDARRHGVIKVPLSMGNCNPPISLTLPPSFDLVEEGRIFVRGYHTLGVSLAPRRVTRDGHYVNLLASLLPSCNALRRRGRHVVRVESTAEKWPPLVASEFGAL